jgi:hypothetical protein
MNETESVQIPRADAAIFIGLTANLEQYMGPAPDERTLHSLVNRLRRDLVRYGLATDEPTDQTRAVRDINQRLHGALERRSGNEQGRPI